MLPPRKEAVVSQVIKGKKHSVLQSFNAHCRRCLSEWPGAALNWSGVKKSDLRRGSGVEFEHVTPLGSKFGEVEPGACGQQMKSRDALFQDSAIPCCGHQAPKTPAVKGPLP